MRPNLAEAFLIIEPVPLAGPENMRRDEALLDRVEQSPAAVTWVRFYRWDFPTVSLGRHQKAEEAVDLHYCRTRSIPVVRRPTGGRAVLHGDELTYAVVSNDFSRFPADITGTYLVIARALQAGLAMGGVRAEINPGARSVTPGTALENPCFASVSRHELTIQGRKVAGSAQRRSRRGFLQHGSVPLTLDYEMMEGAFQRPARELESSFTGLSEFTDFSSFDYWAQAFASAFEESLGLLLRHVSFP